MSRRSLALLGFLLHVPGLWLFARAKLSRRALVLNAWALGVTFAAMGAAAAFATERLAAVFFAWLAGHLTWSTTLAVLALQGHVEIAGRA